MTSSLGHPELLLVYLGKVKELLTGSAGYNNQTSCVRYLSATKGHANSNGSLNLLSELPLISRGTDLYLYTVEF